MSRPATRIALAGALALTVGVFTNCASMLAELRLTDSYYQPSEIDDPNPPAPETRYHSRYEDEFDGYVMQTAHLQQSPLNFLYGSVGSPRNVLLRTLNFVALYETAMPEEGQYALFYELADNTRYLSIYQVALLVDGVVERHEPVSPPNQYMQVLGPGATVEWYHESGTVRFDRNQFERFAAAEQLKLRFESKAGEFDYEVSPVEIRAIEYALLKYDAEVREVTEGN